MKPTVTIVLPVYNVSPYLDESIQSLLNQTYPHNSIEIIAINDGSTDISLDILKSYEEQCEFLRIINQENKGLGATRNVGLSLAQGKYIYFLDSDDWVDSKLIADCVTAMEQDTLDVCYLQKYVFEDHPEADTKPAPVFHQTKNQNFALQTGRDFLRQQIIVKENCAAISQYFYRTDFLKKNTLLFPEKILHEDEPFTTRVLLLADRFRSLEQAYYYRRLRPGSIMTSTKRLQRAENYFAALQAMHSYFPQLTSEQAELLSCYMSVILGHIFYLLRLNEILKRRSWLWTAAKMTRCKRFQMIPDCFGGLWMITLGLYSASRRFVGKVLRRVGIMKEKK